MNRSHSPVRIVLLGATGQLGSDIVRVAAHAGPEGASAEGATTTVHALPRDTVDVSDPASLAKALSSVRADVVVNSAAFHQVDLCDEDPAQAFGVNALGALYVARAARAIGARTVYISTDYVFGGSKPPSPAGATTSAHAYTEGDPPGPLNVYGASKWAGECMVRQTDPSNLIVRVSSLFGKAGARGKGGNFIEAILKKAAAGGPVRVVADQTMTPTYTWDAATTILELIAGGVQGTIHVTNGGACTWHAFAEEAVRRVGSPITVEAISAKDYPSKVARPMNSALSTDRLAKVRGMPLRRWQDALGAYLVEKGHVAAPVRGA
ncbi:MAG: dTDP-4-dehydrorhamnose reductase [Thermoplasmatota archaeon]